MVKRVAIYIDFENITKEYNRRFKENPNEKNSRKSISSDEEEENFRFIDLKDWENFNLNVLKALADQYSSFLYDIQFEHVGTWMCIALLDVEDPSVRNSNVQSYYKIIEKLDSFHGFNVDETMKNEKRKEVGVDSYLVSKMILNARYADISVICSADGDLAPAARAIIQMGGECLHLGYESEYFLSTGYLRKECSGYINLEEYDIFKM